eukprot:TRINITY_DN3386_c0_g2_i3.p1 TRINITY_DN3386_c0_g2~~TRINITY_DN3386_c0_g2_i3.p1  ORF type:complete len:633 (+),score=197.63 TRINITY_DN3386_c0_g2_i3:790-2688(+)
MKGNGNNTSTTSKDTTNSHTNDKEDNEDGNNDKDNNNNNGNETLTNETKDSITNDTNNNNNNNNNLTSLAQLFASTEDDEDEEIIEEDDTGVIPNSTTTDTTLENSQNLTPSVDTINSNTNTNALQTDATNNTHTNNNNDTSTNTNTNTSNTAVDNVNMIATQQPSNTHTPSPIPNSLQLNLSHLLPYFQALPLNNQAQIQTYISQQSLAIYKQHQTNANQMMQKHQQEELLLQTQQGNNPNFPSTLANLRQTHNLQKQKLLQVFQQQKQGFLSSLQEKVPAYAAKVKIESSLRISSDLIATETLNISPHNSSPIDLNVQNLESNTSTINSELTQSSSQIFLGSPTITSFQITPIAGLVLQQQPQQQQQQNQQQPSPYPSPQLSSTTHSAPLVKFPVSSSGYSSSFPSKSKSENDWSLTERAKFQRALVKYGTDFSLLSQAIGSKRSGIVKRYYFDQGGAKGPENKILLNAHHQLKKIDGVVNFPAELQKSDYEAIKLGLLPKLNLSFLTTPKEPVTNIITNTNSNSTTNHEIENATSTTNTTNTNTTSTTNTANTTNVVPEQEQEEEDEGVDDPTSIMNETEKKLYKRTRAAQILKANNRNIFYIDDDSENFISSLLEKEKKKRVKKLINV